MKKAFLFFLTLSSLSCAVYVPNVVNVPALHEKNDLHLGLHAGNGLNIQGAYAITNNIGIMANVLNTSQTVVTNDVDERDGKGSLYELGLGYFVNTSSAFRFETFAGYGFGQVDIDRKKVNTTAIRNFSASANRWFIQPNLGVAKNNIEFYISARYSNVSYNDIKSTYTNAELTEDKFVNIGAKSWAFIEPAVTIRAGVKRLKGQIQLGRAIKITDGDLGFDSGLFSIGFVAQL